MMYLGTDTRLKQYSQGNSELLNLGYKPHFKEALRIVKDFLDKSRVKVGEGKQ